MKVWFKNILSGKQLFGHQFLNVTWYFGGKQTFLPKDLVRKVDSLAQRSSQHLSVLCQNRFKEAFDKNCPPFRFSEVFNHPKTQELVIFS